MALGPAPPVRRSTSRIVHALLAGALAVALAAPAHAQPRRAQSGKERKKLIIQAPDRSAEPDGDPAVIHPEPEPQRAPAPLIPRTPPKPWRAPLAAKPGTPLWADSVREALAYETEVRVGAYDRVGARDAHFDEKVHQVLAAAAASAADPAAPGDGSGAENIRKLITEGCNDPLIRACFAAELAASSSPGAAIAPLQDAASAMRASRYGAYLKGGAVANLASVLMAAGQRDKAMPLFREAADFYVVALTSATETKMPPQHALLRLDPRVQEQFPPEITRAMCDRLASGGADHWLVSMLWGRYFERLAWDARGRGPTASAEGLKAFNDNQVKARGWYEDAYRIDPGRPGAPAAMIGIVRYGLARPGQDLKYWFDLALDSQFDYPQTFANTLEALRPRAGGDYAAMLGFGLSCAQSERYDTIVPLQLVRAALEISADMQDDKRVWTFPKVYEISKQVLTRYIQANPERAPYYRALLAGIAWRAGKYEDAQLLLDVLGPKGDLSAISAVRAAPREMIEDVNAHTGPAAEIYEKADEAAARGDLTAVVALCEQAVEVCRSSPPPIQAAAAAKLAEAKFDESFESGHWTDLRFEPGLPLWTNARGRWNPLNDTTIRAEPTAAVAPVLALRTAIGMRFEIQGEITFSPLANPGAAGFGIGYDSFAPGDTGWYGVTIFPAASKAGLGVGWVSDGDRAIPPARGPYAFDAICYDGVLRLNVNGQAVFAGPIPRDSAWRRGEGLVLGARASTASAPVTFSNLKLRKLLEDPSPRGARASK